MHVTYDYDFYVVVKKLSNNTTFEIHKKKK